MNVTLVAYTPVPETVCGNAAGRCYRGDGEKALKAAMRGGHESVLEHAVFTFQIEGVSRVLLAQLTRHRLCSFTVESQRYTDTFANPYYLPEGVLKSSRGEQTRMWMEEGKRLYAALVADGVAKEDARYILPQAVTTSLTLTANARELRHIFALRCCNRAQAEIRELAWEMLELCKSAAPMLFADAGPGCVRGKCPETKPCGKPYAGKEQPVRWNPVAGLPAKSGFYAAKVISPITGKTVQTRRFFIAESRTWYGDDGIKNDVAYWKEWQDGDRIEPEETAETLFVRDNGADDGK